MSIFSKLFGRKQSKVGNVEDFTLLTRVYFQSVIASSLGITNINMVPDVANFKRLFKIQTQKGKLGLAEKSRSAKMLMEEYGLREYFFKEIDASIKKNCRTQNDVQSYLFMYQGFANDLMMLTGNLMQWKLRVPGKKMLYTLTEKTIGEILTKTDWKKEEAQKTALSVRKYQQRLGFSQKWITDYVYHVLLLAKKESRSKKKDEKE